MSATAEKFASIDTQLAAARAAWEEDRTTLEKRIHELEVELALTKGALDKAGGARDEAFRTTAKLLTQFGIVATVFAEAKQVAMEAGLYTESTKPRLEQKEASDVVVSS